MSNRKIHIRIRPEDRARIEMIREAYGIPMAGAVRSGIRALCVQLGLEKNLEPDEK
jgi:hypothetical protein